MSATTQLNLAEAAVATESTSLTDFESLLNKEFKPKSDTARDSVALAVRTLAEQALAQTQLVSDDALSSIGALIKAIDETLTRQINLIIHHEDFQQLESGWRGLHHLVNNTETDETLKIKVFNVSKKELGRTLKKFRGTAWDQSPIFKRIYEEEFGQFGGEPFGMLVGDFYFDHGPQDVQLLGDVAQIAAAAHAPFLAAAAPSVMQLESWTELNNPRDLTKIFQTPEYAAWRSLRESEDSRYLALCMPRFLARLPWGAKTEPVDEFAFEEDTAGGASENYTWCNSAYAMATNVTRAFKLFGWCSQIRGIESGGGVEGLPAHTFPDLDGGVAMKCPTEVAIPDRREAELSKNGFMPLIFRKNSDFAAFIGAQSLQKPQEYDDPAATANANLAARLPYLFASCRFAHYLKCMVRDKVGSSRTMGQLQRWLDAWLRNYIDAQPDTSPDEWKATHPLADGKVELEANESDPGYYRAKIYLKPHYQLEGVNVSLRLVSRMPQ
jgi:type VI secretion system protein ImpC